MDKNGSSMSTYSAHREAYTQSPLACTKRCLHTIKSQLLRDTGR